MKGDHSDSENGDSRGGNRAVEDNGKAREAQAEADARAKEIFLAAQEGRGDFLAEPRALDSFNADWRGPGGRTALMAAAKAGETDCLKRLLPLGFLDAQDNDGLSALMLAAQSGRFHCVEALLAAAARTDLGESRDGHNALMLAISNSWHSCARRLMPRTDLAQRSRRGFTALMIAAKGSPEMTRELLLGSDPLAVGQHELTALWMALNVNVPSIVATLAPVSDLSRPNPDGETPLLHAAAHVKWGCAEAMAERAPLADVERALAIGAREGKALPRLTARLEAHAIALAMAEGARSAPETGAATAPGPLSGKKSALRV